MAEVQIAEPQVGDNFTDRGWRAANAGQTGVLDDFDGSAFGITTPAEGNVVELGSTTQPSRLAVDGYGLEIPKSTTQSLTIPASTSGTAGRTDLIVARLNLTGFAGDPGPVRLHRVPGTEGSTNVPAATYDPVGIRDLVLYRIRRIQGQGLNQAIVTDMRPRLGHNYDVHNDGELPVNAPLASRASRGSVIYRRDLVSGAADWVVESEPPTVLTGTSFTSGSAFPGWSQQATQRLVYDQRTGIVLVHIEVRKSGGQIVASSSGSLGDNTNILTLNSTWRPPAPVSGTAYVTSDAGVERNAGARINSQGVVQVTSTQPGAAIRTVTIDVSYAKG